MFRAILHNIRHIVLDLVAPELCCVCRRRLVAGERHICTHCLVELPRTGYYGDSTPMSAVVANGIARPGFTAAWFFYKHTSPYADIVRRAKFSDRPSLAHYAGTLMARELIAQEQTGFAAGSGQMPFSAVQLLLPVPMHWSRRLRRGFNQSVEIARGIAEVTDIPVVDNLVALKHHPKQSRRRADKRRKNLVDNFAVADPHELDGKHIVIVDDVVTTGATVAECVRAISVSGAMPASIGIIALGYVGD